MKTYTIQDIKQARDGIAAAFSIDTLAASKIIGYFNADPGAVSEMIAGKYTRVSDAAEALGIALKDPSGPGDQAKKDRPKKAPKKKSALSVSDDVPRVQGDIITDVPGVLPDNVPALVMDVINSYCEQNNISDLSKERQPRWSAACCMVGESVFKKSKILHDTLREKQHGGTVYDVGRVSALVDLWDVLCKNFCKVPLIDDFARFAGVADSWVYASNLPGGLTPARASLLQKLKRIQETGLAGMIVDGRQNPTGALAALNHWHGWTQTREIVHTSGAAAPVAPSLPVFDGAGGLLVDNSVNSVDN